MTRACAWISAILWLAAAARGQSDAADTGPATQPDGPQARLAQLLAENRRLHSQLDQLKEQEKQLQAKIHWLQGPDGAAAPRPPDGPQGAAPPDQLHKLFKSAEDLLAAIPESDRPLPGAAWSADRDTLTPRGQLAAHWAADHLVGCTLQFREEYSPRNVSGGRGQIVSFKVPFSFAQVQGTMDVTATFDEALLPKLQALKEHDLVPVTGTISYCVIEPGPADNGSPHVALELENAGFYALPDFLKDAKTPGGRPGGNKPPAAGN